MKVVPIRYGTNGRFVFVVAWFTARVNFLHSWPEPADHTPHFSTHNVGNHNTSVLGFPPTERVCSGCIERENRGRRVTERCRRHPLPTPGERVSE